MTEWGGGTRCVWPAYCKQSRFPGSARFWACFCCPVSASAAKPVPVGFDHPYVAESRPARPRRRDHRHRPSRRRHQRTAFPFGSAVLADQAPILGRAGQDQALVSNSNDPLGARYTGVFQDLTTPQNPSLAPNASVDFTLRVRVSDLELSPTDGIYLMGVHVLQRGNNVAVGRTRVFVPVVAGKPSSMLTTTTIVTLNSRPSLVRKGVFSDDHLAAEVGENGRLTALLKAADINKTTFAIDPALIDELKIMSAGYQVLDSEGTTSAGTGQADATRWLESFEALRTFP